MFKPQNYWQGRLAIVCMGGAQEHDHKWIAGYTLNSEIDDHIVFDRERVRLSDICLRMGLFSSRKDFQRNVKMNAIRYNETVLSNDIEIDLLKPSFDHEVRFGRKFLEFVVPSHDAAV